MLKNKINKDDWEKLDKAIQAEYTLAGDGNYHLQAEDDGDLKKKVDEFRQNNIQLMKDLKELRDQFKDVDPVKYKEYQEKIQKLEEKKLLDEGQIEKVLEQKTERMKKTYDDQIAALTKAVDEGKAELAKTKGHLSSVLIDSEITKAVAGKARKGAMDDILARGRRTWVLDENGKPVPKEGEKILYGKDGKQHMTFEEWAQVQMETAPFLFEPSSGGGSKGNDGKQSGPISKEDMMKLPPSERLKMAHQKTAQEQAR